MGYTNWQSSIGILSKNTKKEDKMAMDFEYWVEEKKKKREKNKEREYVKSLPDYATTLAPDDRKYYEYVDDYRDGRDSVWRKKKKI